MRIVAALFLLGVIVAGGVFGALNAGLVTYDLVLVQWRVPKGAALLVALLFGWLLGGLTAWSGTRLRQRRQPRESKPATPQA